VRGLAGRLDHQHAVACRIELRQLRRVVLQLVAQDQTQARRGGVHRGDRSAGTPLRRQRSEQ
jgi:hypothetical protein